MKLIDNVHHAWRFWSVRLSAVAAAVLAYLTMFPDAIVWAWNELPSEFKTMIPEQYLSLITAFVFIMNIVLRVIKQKHPAKDSEDDYQNS